MGLVGRKIDPASGDYVRAGGKFVFTDPLELKIALSVTLPLGSWEGDPLIGHELAKLSRALDTDETLLLAEQILESALRWLVVSGELERVEVEVQRFEEQVFAFQTKCFPPGRQQALVRQWEVSVGGG